MHRNLILIVTCLVIQSVAAAQENTDAPFPAERLRGQRHEFEAIKDIVFARHGEDELTLHLFRPKTTGPHPAVLVIPGGAWRMKMHWTQFAKALAREGIAAITMIHRTVPRHRHPAQIEDCRRAIQTIRSKAKELQIDPERIGVAGVSSGGHLAALLGTEDDASDSKSEDPIARMSTRPRCVVALSAPMDLQIERGQELSSRQIRLVAGFLGVDPEISEENLEEIRAIGRAASPRHQLSADDPPFFIVHGSRDRIVPVEQARDMAASLRKAKMRHEYIEVEGSSHIGYLGAGGGPMAWAPRLRSLPAPQYWKSMRSFLRRHLLGLSGKSPVVEGAIVKRIATGFKFTEGPAADDQGSLYFTDIPNDRIHRWRAGGVVDVFNGDSGGANGLYFDSAGRLHACEGKRRRLVRYEPDGGAKVLASEFAGKPLNSPNDLWIDPRGGIYFTDPRYGNQSGLEQEGFHVYYLPPKGRPLVRVADDLVKPNGILGRPNGKRLYVADAGAGRVLSYRIEPDGSLKDKTLFASARSDGMTLDDQGRVYVTERRVLVFDSNGNRVAEIDTPERPSNVCFAGPDRKTLVITARTSVYSVQIN